MRRALDFLYAATGFLAAAAMVGIAGLILAQVTLRAFGSQLQSADDFAGYALVATTLLGLAPTYRHNAHIRVGLLIDRFRPGTGVRVALERLVSAGAALLTGWAAWISLRYVHGSYVAGEMSQGLVAVPLWIPQSAMALGLTVFFIALLDDLAVDLAGGTQSHLAAAAAGEELLVEH